MRKERYFSLAHLLILAAIVGMFYVTYANVIMTVIIAIARWLPVGSHTDAMVEFIMEQPYLQKIVEDLLSNEPFSIVFTSAFAAATIFMQRCSFDKFVRTWISSLYCVILYLGLFSAYFFLNTILETDKATVFIIVLFVILINQFYHGIEQSKLWSSMDKEPKYHTFNLLSMLTLIVSTAICIALIMLADRIATSFILMLSNMLNLSYLIEFLIVKAIELIKIALLIIVWMDMGVIHDSIIARELENRER